MLLKDFNGASRPEIISALRPCLDIQRWVEQIADERPFSSVEDLLNFARSAASPFAAAEVESALSHHPRIGEVAAGESSEAKLSRGEQDALGESSDAVIAALAEGNRSYEEKFGRVFLIRAAGRSKEEILEALQVRISHTANEEEPIVQQQLREISIHRLRGMMSQ
ncbi:2-oxo-4-hydroxy-4-carboxy-5-ureidoimidazoline decarboxylase [Arthrobacter sp. H16F315]|uniref:2-oxo-4-hydroxy-4-carboxy-5-ureidoimidazoline decarboxylase n=1 Tax=Arthrobacter sp. H16F315 TaxID=2955314 RepID=UPI002096F6BC|nr:2-oxo-4-hydroxy-4-carboxy-5-ureidoimidazoline decarboxylase [Arthrobacter sp. H16F315]MDD1477769.1 2-oxo-4-hydroxy-4-carboxy-5-ureidoimidazoline decarboxylase [Arthrobacter sp. H16F315]